ncbi:MAG: hypothetical protein BRD49_00190 [Bacteroidetes bacterium SW_10_40_5]|nr:MAG: hypothetical protein BRD49_00190 [Bacteroidetes bacterium SW_10_40_5]
MGTLNRKLLQKIQLVSTNFKRYLHSQIKWENRLNVIKGARGVGKKTLLVQYIKDFHFLKKFCHEFPYSIDCSLR